jgi:hypothetical protein
MTGTGIWAGYHSGVYKLHVGNPTGAGFTWDGTVFTIRGADGSVLLASGSGVPYAKVSGVPTSLSGINSTEATKLAGIQAGATVGADASNLNVGMGGNLLANTEFAANDITPIVIQWNPSSTTVFFGAELTRDPSGSALPDGLNGFSVWQGNPSNPSYNVAAMYSLGTIPAVAGVRYELSLRFNTYNTTAQFGFVFLDSAGTQLGSTSTGFIPGSGGGKALADWTKAVCFATAPPGTVSARPYIMKGDTSAGQTYSVVIMLQPHFGVATTAQTVASAYTPGTPRGALANLSKITAGNASTYIESAAIGNAQIGGDIWSSNFTYGSAGWLIRRDGYAEFMNVLARGNIEATSINTGSANIVSTLHLQGEAVTVPRSVYTAATLAGITSEVAVQSLYIDTQGSPVIIIFTCMHTYSVSFRILDPAGSVVYSGGSGDSLVAYKNFAVSCVGAVSGTYTVYASAASVAAVGQRGLVLLGAKR